MELLSRLFGRRQGSETPVEVRADDHLMISQHAAFYVYQNSGAQKKQYMNRLMQLGYSTKEAAALFNFECDVLRRFDKRYMLEPYFTKRWLFNLSRPFFVNEPSKKDAIMKEHFLTLSEICKIIDEAEWHFWNSHEKQMPDDVWYEITTWRLQGPGAEFTMKYSEMIAQETRIPLDKIAKFVSNEGGHLNKYKWQ